MVRLAIDMMDDDNTPDIVLGAVQRAVEDFKDLEVILFGNEKKYSPNHERIGSRHYSEETKVEDKPVGTTKRKKDSSMVKMAEAVKFGKADGCVSTGNTGALMPAGLFIVGRIRGVARPTLVVTLPTTNGKGLISPDVGTSADAKPEHLLQYAQLRDIYAQKIRGIDNPKILLLSIGTEPAKGSSLAEKSYELLNHDHSLNSVGNIEAKTSMDGDTDVVATDGYTGDIILKNLEGTAKSIGEMLKDTIMSSIKNKLAGAILKKDLAELVRKMDHSKYGGPALLRLGGTIIETHGSSNTKAFYSTIRQARIMGEQNVVQTIKKTIGESNE